MTKAIPPFQRPGVHPIAKSRPCHPLHCPPQGQTALPPRPPPRPGLGKTWALLRAPTGGGVCQMERGLPFPRRLKQHAPPPTLPSPLQPGLRSTYCVPDTAVGTWGPKENKRRPIPWCSQSRLGSAAFVCKGQRGNILGVRAPQLCLYGRKPLSRQMGVAVFQ